MNKYKLINKTTGEEYICEKMVVDGRAYYVSDEPIKDGERGISINNAIYTHSEHLGSDYGKKLIATNNLSRDSLTSTRLRDWILIGIKSNTNQ